MGIAIIKDRIADCLWVRQLEMPSDEVPSL